MTSGDTIINTASAYLNIEPGGFYVYAKHFLKGTDAYLLEPKTYSPVSYYLYCRAIELALKAYLLANGHKIENLKDRNKLGHNLEKAIRKAQKDGIERIIPINKGERELLVQANNYYNTKGFEYISMDVFVKTISGHPDLPELTALKKLATKLVNGLREYCLSAG